MSTKTNSQKDPPTQPGIKKDKEVEEFRKKYSKFFNHEEIKNKNGK